MTEPTTTKQTSPDAEAATFRIWTGIPVLSLVYYKLGMWLDSPILVMAGRSRIWGARAKWWHRLFLAAAPFAIIFITINILFLQTPSFSFKSMGSIFLLKNSAAFLGGVLTLALAGAAIAGEKEKQSLEALFVTPLSSARIVFDKFVLAVCPALLLQAFLLPGIILAMARGMAPPWFLLASHIYLLATLLAFGAIGVFCSSRSRNTVTGVIAALLAGWLWILAYSTIDIVIWRFWTLAPADHNSIFQLMALAIAIQLLFARLFFYLTAQHLHALRSGQGKAAMPLFADR